VALTLASWSRDAAARLAAAGFPPDDARQDVGAIVRGTLDWDLGGWITHQQDPVDEGTRHTLDRLVERRSRREPVAYLTGRREFHGRDFLVSPAVLIPRPETELLVEIASDLIASFPPDEAPWHIVDVGTGSGAIAVTLAADHPSVRVTATDVSEAALAVARTNAERHGVAGRVTFVQSPLLGGTASVDLVVSNPPYVARADEATLADDVRRYEPHLALFGGDDGLEVIRALVPAAAASLRPGGWLVMEIGAGQAEAVTAILASSLFEWQRTAADLSRHPRAVIARWRPGSL
jgi:release factor glutamine methyltransferase